MSIPESCIKAANANHPWADETAEDRARRVILALAEEMLEDALDAALWAATPEDRDNREAMRAAIAAFLKHVAGETP